MFASDDIFSYHLAKVFVTKIELIEKTPMVKKSITTLWGSLTIFFAGLWLVVRIVLEYFGIISDGNDRTTGIKDLREEYKKANYK